MSGRVGVRRAVAVAAVLVPLLLATGSPAGAHSRLLRTEPGQHAVVTGAEAVSLQFDGEILDLGAAMRVTGPGGEVPAGRPSVVGDRITLPLRGRLGDGSYQVLWRATAADGHPASGSWSFTVSASGPAPSRSAGPAPAERAQPPTPAAVTDPGSGWPLEAMIAVAVLVVLASCGVLLAARRRRAVGAGS